MTSHRPPMSTLCSMPRNDRAIDAPSGSGCFHALDIGQSQPLVCGKWAYYRLAPGRLSDDLSIPSIVPDEFDGDSAAVNALIEQSHTWSSFINNANGIPASRCQNVRM